MKSVNRKFTWHFAGVSKIDIVQTRGLDQLKQQPVRIHQAKSSRLKAQRDFFTENAMFGETRFPVFDCALRNRKTGRNHLPRSARSAARSRPGKKGDCR